MSESIEVLLAERESYREGVKRCLRLADDELTPELLDELIAQGYDSPRVIALFRERVENAQTRLPPLGPPVAVRANGEPVAKVRAERDRYRDALERLTGPVITEAEALESIANPRPFSELVAKLVAMQHESVS